MILSFRMWNKLPGECECYVNVRLCATQNIEPAAQERAQLADGQALGRADMYKPTGPSRQY